MRLIVYLWQIEIMHEQGSYFSGHDVKDSLKCGLNAKPTTPWNSQAHYRIIKINKVLVKLIRMVKIESNYIY